MNALEAASLVIIPSGYENGTLGSLKPLDGTGDFTFSRGSDISATRVNEDGYIEKGYENLLLQSNTFSDAAWQKIFANVTGGQAGYDGSNDAWKVNSNSIYSNVRQTQNQTGLVTLSVYAKKGEYDYVGLYFSGNVVGVIFSLIDGGVENPIFTYPDIYANGESVGNGWYRFSITHNLSNTGRAEIFVCETTSYNGNTTTGEGIYIQDAMLNQGMVAYPYVETTTAPVAGGILEDMPRLDYSGSCASLKLEPQRTNKLPYSEYFGAWTTQSGITLTPNTDETTSPEGLKNAYKIVSTNGTTGFYYTGLNSSADSIRSIYLKGASGGETLFLKDPSGNGGFTSVTLTTEWQRFTHSTSNTGQNYQGLQIDDISVGTIYAYGAQWEEQATYPTSYIPTYGTSQTRLVDVCSKTGVSSLIGQTEGTLFAEFTPTSNLNTDIVQLLADTALDNGVSIGCGVGNIYGSVYTDSSYRFNVLIAQTIPNNTFKVAICYKTNDFTFFVNGVKVASGANSYSPSSPLTRINFNQAFFFGNQVIDYKSVLVFPVKLSDADCITLTTL